MERPRSSPRPGPTPSPRWRVPADSPAPLDQRDQLGTGPGPMQHRPAFVAARATVYRKSTHTLLVASEGQDRLVELDALSVDPSASVVATHDVSGRGPM